MPKLNDCRYPIMGLFSPLACLLLALAFFLPGCGGANGDAGGRKATQAANIIITNDSPQVRKQGQFQSIDGYLSRSNKVLKSTGGGNSVVFSPGISERGFYRVYVWWPQARSAGNAAVIVHHQGGVARISVNQQVLGGQWNAVGTYELTPPMGADVGAAVEIADHDGAPALIDAVRFEYVGNTQPALGIETTALPLASQDGDYAALVSAVGGNGPYTWAVAQGQLPPGLSLDAGSGLISGHPGFLGRHQFTLRVADGRGEQAEKRFSLAVLEPAAAISSEQPLDFSAGRKRPLDGRPAGSPPDLSGLIGVIAALPEGEWARVNLNAYSEVWSPTELRTLVEAGTPTPDAIIRPWSGFAWDPNRGDLLLYGGGHANYSGNDVYRWRGTSRRWERASLPSEIIQNDLGDWMAVDGPDAAPPAAHTYDNNIFFPHIDRLVLFGGAAFNSGGPYVREVTPTTRRQTGPYFFDPAKANANEVGGSTGSHVKRVAPHAEIIGGNMWQNRDMYIHIPSHAPFPSEHINGCTAYAEEAGKDVAYMVATAPGGGSDKYLYKYTVNNLADPAQDRFDLIGIFWSAGTADQTACGYDAIRKVLVRIGENSFPFTYWDVATPGPDNRDLRIIPTDPTGEFATLLSTNNIRINNCGFDFDPVRRRFVLWCGGGRVWMLTPPATISPGGGWIINKQPTPTRAVPTATVGTGILGKWKYIDNLDAFMALEDIVQGNIWVYKPLGWQNPQGGAKRPNVAAKANGGVASATTTYNASYAASGANNGDRRGLNWGAGGGWNDATSGSYPDALQINFSGTKTISEIDVFTIQDAFATPLEPTPTMTFSQYGITDFDVQYWNGSTWVTIPGGSVSGNNLVWRKFGFAAIATNTIRIKVRNSAGALGRYSRIAEVEAY